MGFKLFIVLVWLAVPATLTLLVRTDMQRFNAESKQQAKTCLARSADIGSSAGTLLRQGRQLEFCRSPDDLRNWQRDWRQAVNAKDRALHNYDRAAVDHCPATARMLAEQEQRLADLTSKLTSAERDQEYSLRSEEVLDQMENDLEVLTWQSNYYRAMPGGRGVYFYLQEELAKLETRFDAQQHEQSRLQEAVQNQVFEAERTQVELQRELGNVDTLLAKDGSQTYLDSVKQRWAGFDLREQVVSLLTRLAGAH